MSQLNLPLERLQQFGVQAPSVFDQRDAAPSGYDAHWPSEGGAMPARRPGDGISLFPTPRTFEGGNGYQDQAGSWGSESPGFGSIGSLLKQLLGMLQELLNPSQSANPQQFFTDATASSAGDPHLSFQGTQGNGETLNRHFDSMVDHPDLLSSRSFEGGFRISTEVTQPDANGVTTNKRATIASNYGETRVSMDNSGNASITRDGQAVAIAAGQTLNLGEGETVTENSDGSLTVVEVNERGGQVSTNLSGGAGMVSVNSTAHDVRLGGDLVHAVTP